MSSCDEPDQQDDDLSSSCDESENQGSSCDESDHQDDDSMSMSDDEECEYLDDDMLDDENDVGDLRYNKVTFKWVIKKFSKRYKSATNGDLWQAPFFRFEDFHWYLYMYPKGANKFTEGYLSLSLSTMDDHRGAIASLFIVDKNDQEVNKRTTGKMKYPSQYSEHEFLKFIQLDELFSKPELLSGDTLTIGCELLFNTDPHQIRDIYCLNEYEKLFEDGMFGDVKFLVEGKEILGHKGIIASRSPVFAAMFKHKMEESDQNIVKITDFSSAVMTELLRFIYSGKVKNMNDLATDLLIASDKYHIERLKILCESHLSQNICYKNVGEYLNFANIYNTPVLKEGCRIFIVQQIEVIGDTPILRHIREIDKDLWLSIYQYRINLMEGKSDD